MRRSSGTSGGRGHIELVKLTTKRIVDKFDSLKNIQISYEESEFEFDLKIKDSEHS